LGRVSEWTEWLNRSNHTLWLLGVASFLETIIVPIPIELVLVPLMAIQRQRIWLIATVALAGCLAASLLGYGVGVALYQSVGIWFVETMGYQDAYQSFQTFFDRHGFAAILVVGILPIPFQIAMITAGLSNYPLLLFVLATVIARGIRYFGLAWLVSHFGRAAGEMWRRHAVWTSIAAGALVGLIYVVSQYLAGQII